MVIAQRELSICNTGITVLFSTNLPNFRVYLAKKCLKRNFTGKVVHLNPF